MICFIFKNDKLNSTEIQKQTIKSVLNMTIKGGLKESINIQSIIDIKIEKNVYDIMQDIVNFFNNEQHNILFSYYQDNDLKNMINVITFLGTVELLSFVEWYKHGLINNNMIPIEQDPEFLKVYQDTILKYGALQEFDFKLITLLSKFDLKFY